MFLHFSAGPITVFLQMLLEVAPPEKFEWKGQKEELYWHLLFVADPAFWAKGKGSIETWLAQRQRRQRWITRIQQVLKRMLGSVYIFFKVGWWFFIFLKVFFLLSFLVFSKHGVNKSFEQLGHWRHWTSQGLPVNGYLIEGIFFYLCILLVLFPVPGQ